jgi:hypothetical protein
MARQTKRRVGRPKTTGPGTLIGIRLQRRDLKDLDDWRKREGVSRQEAIRRFIRASLAPTRPGEKSP